MTTLRQSTQIVNKTPPVPSANGATGLIYAVGDFSVPAGLVVNDVVELVPIPAGYVPVEAIFDMDATDSNGTPLMTLDIGIISGTYGAVDNTRTVGTEAAAADTTVRAGGVFRPTKLGFGRIAPATADRGFGVLIKAAAATLVTTAKWRMTLVLRPKSEGV